MKKLAKWTNNKARLPFIWRKCAIEAKLLAYLIIFFSLFAQYARCGRFQLCSDVYSYFVFGITSKYRQIMSNSFVIIRLMYRLTFIEAASLRLDYWPF